MFDPPSSLGERFIQAVERKEKNIFRHLVATTDYRWGIYFRCLSPEDQEWAVANRPEKKELPEHSSKAVT